MSQNIVITGGSGLLAINWALTRRECGSVTLALHQREIALAGVDVRWLDLDSVDKLQRELAGLQPDLVIHAAGFTNVEECEAKPDLARYINVDLAVNVALACKRLQLPLAHISTDHLFSTGESMADESTPTSPNNVYGRTKAEAEQSVLDTHADALVVRTNFYAWGPGYRQSFSDLIIGSLRAGENLTLFTDVHYTPIFVETLARTVHELVQLEASGIFHVVGDDRISKHEFGLRLTETFDLDRGLIEAGMLAEQTALVQRPYDMSLSNKKTCDLLGHKLGGVSEQLSGLLRQEQLGLAREVQAI
jgi:dTDP-4-dehydrorhamnose reductase